MSDSPLLGGLNEPVQKGPTSERRLPSAEPDGLDRYFCDAPIAQQLDDSSVAQAGQPRPRG